MGSGVVGGQGTRKRLSQLTMEGEAWAGISGIQVSLVAVPGAWPGQVLPQQLGSLPGGGHIFLEGGAGSLWGYS